MPEIDMLPEAMRSSVKLKIEQWNEQLHALNSDFQPTSELSASLVKVWSSSLFV